MQIKSRFDDRVLYECEAETMLGGANLDGANLDGAKVNWNSHSLIGAILRLAAGGDVDRRCLAGGIAISTDWCWDRMLAIEHPQKAWALSVLIPLIQDGDNAPEQLRRLVTSAVPESKPGEAAVALARQEARAGEGTGIDEILAQESTVKG